MKSYNVRVRRLAGLYHSLPSSVRGLLAPVRLLFGLRGTHELYLLEGLERSGGKPLTLACTGTPDLKAFLLKRAFADGGRARSLGQVPVGATPDQIAALAPEADLLVLHIRPSLELLPRRGVFARLPAWVRTQLDLQAEDCLSRGKLKTTRIAKAIEKAGFTHELTKDEAQVAEFYHDIHIPHVSSRHGESASIVSLDETLTGIREGGWELIRVKRGGALVAGGTVQLSGEMARFWQLGVHSGDPSLLAAGAADAVYYHAIAAARSRGFARMHLGHSRPFARDGVLDYKRMFGGYVADAHYELGGSLDVCLRRMTPGVEDFLVENPLIALDPDGRYRFYGFVRGSEAEMRKAVAWWRPRYCFKGTLDLRVFVVGDGPPRERPDLAL